MAAGKRSSVPINPPTPRRNSASINPSTPRRPYPKKKGQKTQDQEQEQSQQMGCNAKATCGVFGHMYSRKAGLADMRRRSLSMIDVITDRLEEDSGRFYRRYITSAAAISFLYWKFIQPITFASDTSEVDGLLINTWSEARWEFAFLVTIGYLFVVFAGIRYMERRQPAQKLVFEYMLVYNILQVILNGQLAYLILREVLQLGLEYPWGNSVEVSSPKLSALLWLQYHYRQLDLLDTVFIVFRKKFSRLFSMHIVLKLIHMWGWFFACRYASGGDTYFPALMNAACQAIVYVYYAISMLPCIQKLFPLKKARFTEVQVFQFVVCGVHAMYVLVRGCLPRSIYVVNLLVMAVSMVLYVDFGKEQPRLRNISKSKKVQAQEQTNKEHLTFCFDSSAWLYAYHWGVAQWIQENVLPEGISPESASSDAYPKGLSFSGSSGGALVAATLAGGLGARDIFEFVLTRAHPVARRNPFKIAACCAEALNSFLPEDNTHKYYTTSFSNRLRVLITRVSLRFPFVTGECVNQLSNREDAFATLAASAHIPGVNLCPYRHRGRYYFDGMMWSSIFVPWQAAEDSHLIKVTALGGPLADISAPASPTWWALLPPDVDILRGLFWIGYRDAGRWFHQPPTDPSCRCNCSSRQRNDPDEDGEDPLIKARGEKYRLAQKLLDNRAQKQRSPRGTPSWEMPEIDPVTGRPVNEFIELYEAAVRQSYKQAAMSGFAVATAAVAWLFVKTFAA
eukprot:TRINITY_DN35761_c0_g1_i1.p1 TRINITY_DN35761_c0_g1~~TRINITY_DN35761_c0_g1_i1.p1  ORF type:complete len:736 (+),score=112.38 TRINITY_DN35761_c0_g1_i1:80-2287(+)